MFCGTWEHTGGVDGRVSLEVDPLLAHDTEATLAEALDLWKAVDRPNLLVKIPATQEGLPAITRALAEGVSVNVTLIFSVERYRDVMDAYLEGLEQAAGERADPGRASPRSPPSSSPASTPRSTSGWRRSAPTRRWRCAARPAIANSRLAYAAFQEVFQGKRWAALTAQGARPQRPLWASTGVKNPDYSDTHVRHRARRRRHRQHDAGEDAGGLRRPRRGRRRPGHRHGRAGAGGVRRPRARRRSTSPTCSSCSRTRASTSSRQSWRELLDTVKGQLDAAR